MDVVAYIKKEDFNMKTLSLLLHERRMRRLEKLKTKKEYKDKEEAVKKTLKPERHKRKFTASKIFIALMILLCIQIILYAEWMMYHYADMSQIYVLIGIPTTLIVPLAAYFNKSAKENSQGGIVYDIAMLQNQTEIENNEEENVLKE